jgi:pimeloyl-[acyl-carrier protein] methyl ester esterase
VKIVFVHGWGFGPSIWDAVIAHLPDVDVVRADRGYFGAPEWPAPEWPTVDGPCLAVTHSFGAMALLGDAPQGCCGLLAINGFDRFTAADGHAGVHPRVIDRMIARLESDPAAVLRDFHARLGSAVPAGTPDAARLRDDLLAMRDGDRREASAAWPAPLLALDGADDPLLFPDMRAAQFADAPYVERATVAGGHVLPLTHPEICAAWIERLRVAA